MSVDDNFDEVLRELEDLIDAFDFTIPGKNRSLGLDLADIAAEGIIIRSVGKQEGADGYWLANAPAWAEWKAQNLGVSLIGVYTGQMLSHESVLGDVTITANSVKMAYGTGQPAQRFSTGQAYPWDGPTKSGKPRKGTKKSDLPTDREKAEYFQASGRNFYDFDEEIATAIYDAVADALDDYLTGV